jgi:hypothetical protein
MNTRIYLTISILTISTILFGQTNSLFKIVDSGKVGYINEKGNIEIQPKFLFGNDFSDELASVRLNGRYGFIDKTGNFVIQPKYDYASSFINGIACVYINGNPFFIDKKGKIILDTSYYSIQLIDNTKAIVQTKSKSEGIINLSNQKLILDTVYNSIKSYPNGIFIVTDNVKNKKKENNKNQFAVIDSSGNFIFEFGKYEQINDFIEGYARVEIKDQTNKDGNIDGVIDTKGNLLFQRPYKNNSYIFSDFYNGLAVINLYKYWIPEEKDVILSSEKSYQGFINLKAEIVLNDTLNKYLTNFSNERTFIEDKEGNYRIFDTKLQQVGNNSFERVQNHVFINGFAIVEKDDSWGIIDVNGKYVVEPKYENIHDIGIVDNYFFYGIDVNEDEKLYGIETLDGNKIIEPIIQDFDKSGFVNGLLKTQINQRLTYIDKSGNIVWQEKQENNNILKTLNIDHMNRGYFYAYSKPNDEDIGGFGGSRNFPLKITTENFPINTLSIVVDQNKQDTIQNTYIGYKVFVSNRSKTNIDFNAQDSRLYMKVQAQNEKGIWKDIEYLPSSWCGNSYHTLTLEKMNYWAFNTPKYEGEIKTKLRIELKYLDPKEKSDKRRNRKEMTIYSNEFEGSINPGQFWNKQQYYPNGIMDPYND